MKEEDKKGLLKRLRNIEGKNEEQLKAIEGQGKKQLDTMKNITTDSKLLKTISFFSGLRPEAKKIVRWAKKGKKILLILENLFVQNLIEQFLTSIFLKTR